MIFDRYLNEFRNMSVNDLSQIQKALTQTLDDKRSQEIQALREELNNKANMLGVSPAELLGSKKAKGTRKPVQPKYRITSADGSVHEWSGRGIKPKSFQDYSKEELDARFRI